MVKVNFLRENIIVEVETGTILAECIRKAGLTIETPCNCIGLCGKCRVKTEGDMYPVTPEEKEKLGGETGFRLACMARVRGSVRVEFLAGFNRLKTVNNGYSVDVQADGWVKNISLPLIDERRPLPYADLLGYEINSIDVYEKIAELEKHKPLQINGIVYDNILLDLHHGPAGVFGIAVDIGTTGISAYLVNIETGETLHKVSCLNPQTEFGGDVLSRITYSISTPDGSRNLRTAIIRAINNLIEHLTEGYCLPRNIYHTVIAGNTTMLHFILGVDARSLAKAPYRPVFLKEIDLKAGDIGINMNSNGIVTLLPSASGYVGADILAGIVATGFNLKKKPALFVDIGTNGEIVAIGGGRMTATSTAAGPALEGMNISCGCRAEDGAIDSFFIDEEFNFSFTTIGHQPPAGICGSGLLDVMANLVRRGIVFPNGRFNTKILSRLKERFTDNKLYLTDKVFVTQRDIRQIQLAKGAIEAGILLLLEQVGIPVEEVEEAVIAGAFGYHLNPDSIREIGIIPKNFGGKITFVGNSSVEGARLCLINRGVLKKVNEVQRRIEVLELSTSEKFQDYFIKALSF